jgi:DeoR/GlpR family transcriptional regulator of sugar metabolism
LEYSLKAVERIEKIEYFIKTQGFASVKDLSQQCDVSEMTIRRDLDKLAENGRILRTYGGGVPIPTTTSKTPVDKQGGSEENHSRTLFCDSDVLIATSFDSRYDPILFDNSGHSKFPLIAESVPHKNSLTCVGLDDYKAGFALGKWAGDYVLEHFEGEAYVLDLGFNLPNTIERSRGFLDGLAQSPVEICSVTSLNPQSRKDFAYQLTRDALDVNQDINIIFAINDTNAWGAIQACIELQLDPEEIIVIPFGLEGDTIKNAIQDSMYCKVALAMFPEIVGQHLVDAAIQAYRVIDLPEKVETPFALVTKETLNDFYRKCDSGWELQWDHVQRLFNLPACRFATQTQSLLPECIGIIIPFPDHEWYQNLVPSLQRYADQYNITIEVLDAEKNLADELKNRKHAIARRAAQEIHSGDTIIIDGGVVTRYLLDHLQDKSNLTVITNSNFIIELLKDNPEVTLISTGGILRRNTQSLVGPTAENSLKDMRVDKLFLTVTGVSFDFGLSHTNMSEVTIKQAMIQSAREVILLADHTKFAQESLIQIAPIQAITKLITDRGLPAQVRLQFNTAGIEVIIC